MLSNLYLPSYCNDFYNTVECPFNLSIMFGNWFILAYRTSAFSFSDPPSSAFDLGCESLILWRFWRHWRIFDCDFPWPHSKAFRISNCERQLFRSAVVHTVTCTLYRAVKNNTKVPSLFHNDSLFGFSKIVGGGLGLFSSVPPTWHIMVLKIE